MRQSRKHSLDDILSLSRICYFIDGDGLKDVDLAPLVRIGNCSKHLVQVLSLLEREVVLVGAL